MKRCKKLEKYIQRYTGIKEKVYTVKFHHSGYGAFQRYRTKGYMTICEELVNFMPLIWHEMGHLMVRDDDWIQNEVKAQLWAFKKLKELKYEKIYKDSLMWVMCRCGFTGTEEDRRYRKARKIILEKLINQHKRYSAL